MRLGILAGPFLNCYVSAVVGAIMARFARRPKTGEDPMCFVPYSAPRRGGARHENLCLEVRRAGLAHGDWKALP